MVCIAGSSRADCMLSFFLSISEGCVSVAKVTMLTEQADRNERNLDFAGSPEGQSLTQFDRQLSARDAMQIQS